MLTDTEQTDLSALARSLAAGLCIPQVTEAMAKVDAILPHKGRITPIIGSLELTNEQDDEVQNWCMERFGSPAFVLFQGHRYTRINVRRTSTWGVSGYTYWFRNYPDAFEFRMRWR